MKGVIKADTRSLDSSSSGVGFKFKGLMFVG